MTPELLAEELVIPDISHIVTEDDTPVDNFQSEKQQRLLVEPLYSSQAVPPPFIAAANVGLFYGLKLDPIVPDVFLSLEVQMPEDWSQKQNRSYFVWEFGKMPDVAIEIVSNREGKELGKKQQIYAQIGIPYYVVFDPLKQLQKSDEMNGESLKVWALNARRYMELPAPFWLEEAGVGLTLWEGEFEEQIGTWLRWCDRTGKVVPTGKERAVASEAKAQEAEVKAQEAEAKAQEAEAKAQEAEAKAQEAEAKAQRLAERLRAMGIDPNQD
ncbi:MAG: Uma2 family endonuclease [Drouetiella hepatica Uher 2000/2452]|jgi:Uma2 family endonuclease|uniref:Uma2 family endonuclease n=1 Tax=Drouetiella hepatica Uher 2000/2452 TaxID=904376 RepID=A0A951QC49_9CYAN|nr:Uma2 family endonuclease [Drouetiella hepatica Uher 2000/2452]